jgi:3-dehydroquinate synthase
MTLSDQDVLTKVISKCLKIKAAVVSKDMHESGLRKVLNFGHTIGHAIESCTDYARFKHGEAVILGMQCEAWISWKIGLLNKNDFKKAENLLERIEINGNLFDIEGDDILEKMKVDKKVVKKKVNFILLEEIGHTVIRDDISKDLILESIDYLKGRMNE